MEKEPTRIGERIALVVLLVIIGGLIAAVVLMEHQNSHGVEQHFGGGYTSIGKCDGCGSLDEYVSKVTLSDRTEQWCSTCQKILCRNCGAVSYSCDTRGRCTWCGGPAGAGASVCSTCISNLMLQKTGE